MDIRPKPHTRAAMLGVTQEAAEMIASGDVCAVGVIAVRRDGSVLRKCECTPSNPLSRALIEKLIKEAG